MGSSELQPATQDFLEGLFPSDLFQVDLAALTEERKRKRRPKPSGRRKAGQKSLLTGKDFVLPELVGHAENGDLSVIAGASLDVVQRDQVFRLAERGERALPAFGELSHPEQQLEKRRYFDYLNRVPKQEIERSTRKQEFEIWQLGGPEADCNFLSWWRRKQTRRQAAFMRKANRLANCGFSGRRMDCRNHPDEHQFFGEFKCQCRYCCRCGADIFSALFHKYVGLWPTVKDLLPKNGFRSRIVIAKLDFTAVNLNRMPTSRDIREFNEDIRECMQRVLKLLGVHSKTYGFLWCDEFGGFDQKKNSYNTNLHAHGVYVGPYIPQELLVGVWTELRAEKDGAKIVWISKQKIDNPPADFLECEHRRFVRALGHALKYTGKHVSRSDGERLADLEIAFHTVRRVHTMGRFYQADLRCHAQCSRCDTRCELVNGHEGEHQCRYHGHQNRCPLCDAYLMFPRESGYAQISVLQREGRRELGEVRRQLARDKTFQGPRGPDAQVEVALNRSES